MPEIGVITAVSRSAIPAFYRGGSSESDSSAQAAPPLPVAAIYVNPRLRFDRESALLVIEIRNVQNGEVERSIPNQSIVEAYRRASLTGEVLPGAPIDFSRDSSDEEAVTKLRSGTSAGGKAEVVLADPVGSSGQSASSRSGPVVGTVGNAAPAGGAPAPSTALTA